MRKNIALFNYTVKPCRLLFHVFGKIENRCLRSLNASSLHQLDCHSVNQIIVVFSCKLLFRSLGKAVIQCEELSAFSECFLITSIRLSFSLSDLCSFHSFITFSVIRKKQSLHSKYTVKQKPLACKDYTWSLAFRNYISPSIYYLYAIVDLNIELN